MTDEIIRCNDCGKIECGGQSKFLYNDKWYTEDEAEELGLSEPEDEAYFCGETGEQTTQSIVRSTEDD
jgi:hypothetical protein